MEQEGILDVEPQAPATEGMKEADLNLECSRAGAYYLHHHWEGITDQVLKNAILNAAAHGFGMGIRWAENRYGIQRPKEGHDEANQG